MLYTVRTVLDSFVHLNSLDLNFSLISLNVSFLLYVYKQFIYSILRLSLFAANALVLRSIIPLYLVISLSQFITPMLMVIVAEKEKRIKESMKMIGLRDSVFW